MLLTQLQLKLPVEVSKAKACLFSLIPNHITSYKINKIGIFSFRTHFFPLYMSVYVCACTCTPEHVFFAGIIMLLFRNFNILCLSLNTQENITIFN